MDIPLVLGIMFVVGLGFALYGLSAPRESAKAPKKTWQPQDLQAEKAAKSAAQADTLMLELDKAKHDNALFQQEMDILRKKELSFQSELDRRQVWVGKSDEKLTRAVEQAAEFEKKFIAKERELQNEFAKNVELARQNRELNQNLRDAEEKGKGFSDEIQAQKAQIELLNGQLKQGSQEIRAQLSLIEQMKKKETQSEWVSKSDFNRLNEEYTKLEEELEEKDKRIAHLIEEFKKLKALPAEQPPEIAVLPPAPQELTGG